jgi:glycosyltransferase involved in cell wall biosynthesis
MAMKILQVLHQFLPEHLGGIEIYVRNLSTELLRSGENLLIMSAPGHVLWSPIETVTVFEGLKTIYIENRADHKEGTFAFFKTFKNRAVLPIFDHILTRFQPDVIHFHHTVYLSSEMILTAKKRRIPVVLTVHDFWYLCHKLHLLNRHNDQCNGPRNGAKCAFCLVSENGGVQRWIKSLLYLTPLFYRARNQINVLKSADIIIIPALFLKAIMAPHLKGRLNRMIHIPYGIPHTRSSGVRKKPPKKIRFGYLGSIKQHKGIHLLIEAFNSLDRYKPSLNIHGDVSADKPFYQELRKKYPNDRVFYKGAYDNRLVTDILKDIDVLVVPSIWRETGPMVVLEALASRTPVIAPNLGGMAELVRNRENGFLFEPGDLSSLKNTLQLVLDDPSIIKTLDPRLDKAHTLESNVLKVKAVYQQLI